METKCKKCMCFICEHLDTDGFCEVSERWHCDSCNKGNQGYIVKCSEFKASNRVITSID